MSDKGNYTPGPWEMDEEACFISQYGDVLIMIGQVRGWGWLHRKYGEIEAYEIQKANGKLMAAAPELLEALKKLNEWISPESVYWGSDLNELVESAIKKATL